ncbi:TPA: DUF4435 domain-containing protein [Klebsiella quasipneumoniae]
MSSLQNTITQDDWTGTMILLSRNPVYEGKVFFILEGTTDIAFFNTNVSHEKIHYDTPNCGKPEVIKAVNTLRCHGNNRVYGVCDADFDHISGVTYDNIYFTDFHDLEMMLIEGGVVDKFIDSHTKHDFLRDKNREQFKIDIKNKILTACYSIGILKWLNYRLTLNLNFKGMRYLEFISIQGTDITFNLNNYINHISERSPRRQIAYNEERIIAEYNTLNSNQEDYRNICNGHDFMHILALMFRGDFSTDRNMSKEKVEPLMRMGYNSERFQQTILYSSIEQTLVRH